jgi:hypothetical protein
VRGAPLAAGLFVAVVTGSAPAAAEPQRRPSAIGNGFVLDAPPHEVRRAFTSAHELGAWMGAVRHEASGGPLLVHPRPDARPEDPGWTRVVADRVHDTIEWRIELPDLPEADRKRLGETPIVVSIGPLGPTRTRVGILQRIPLEPEWDGLYERLRSFHDDLVKRLRGRFPPKDRADEARAIRKRLESLAGTWSGRRGEWDVDVRGLSEPGESVRITIRHPAPMIVRREEWALWWEPREGVWRSAFWQGGDAWDLSLDEKGDLVVGVTGLGAEAACGDMLLLAAPTADGTLRAARQGGCIRDTFEMRRGGPRRSSESGPTNAPGVLSLILVGVAVLVVGGIAGAVVARRLAGR